MNPYAIPRQSTEVERLRAELAKALQERDDARAEVIRLKAGLTPRVRTTPYWPYP